MYKKVDIEELYKKKDEIYEKYKQDKTLYRNEYDKICKKIRYWTNDDFRIKKIRKITNVIQFINMERMNIELIFETTKENIKSGVEIKF